MMIKPALTPKEWKARMLPRDMWGGETLIQVTDQLSLAIDKVSAETVLFIEADWEPLDKPHGWAAAVLHGQPFGFTWADVTALEDALSSILAAANEYNVGAEDHGETDREYAAVESVRDRIAALLPPREGT